MAMGPQLRAIALGVAMLFSAMGTAAAHPHVWVTSKSELVFAGDGALVAVRHAWTFDEMFSAYATQGLERDQDGRLTREILAELAEVNVTSLKEFGYFSVGKVGEVQVEFGEPVDYWLEADAEDVLTLYFTLPVKSKAKGKFTLEVYDPTWFVDFMYADEAPVSLANAPAGCSFDVHRPDTASTAATTLSESFFNSLTAASDFGSQFANRVTVTCN